MRRYEMSYKQEAVKLAEEIGATKASKELEIPQGTLDTWVSKSKKGELDTNTTPKRALSLADENKRLQQEVRELKRANEILRKASAFFAASQKK